MALSKLVEYNNRTIGARAAGFIPSKLAGAATGDENAKVEFDDINRNVSLIPNNSSGIIDVVNEFDWNANNLQNAYPKIPKIFLTEREQVESSIISSYYYYTTNVLRIINNIKVNSGGTSSSVAGEIIDKVREYTEKIARTVTGTFDSLAGTNTTNGILNGGYKSVQTFINFIKAINDQITSLASEDRAFLGDYLKSYIGIYLTRPTGFVYVLPYFDNSFVSANNSWSTLDRGMPVHDAIDAGAAAIMPFFQPGVYIERPKYFEFQTAESDSVTVRFPLLNTVTPNAYKKNYELLWILAFQNKYFRESFASVRPSKIYTMQIPGVKYFPYSYISRLEVDFVGTRRNLEVETPRGTVEAPVPDAYMVTMTINSLLSDSSNTLLSDQFYRQIRTSVQ
jgi:hypothetical protein